MQGRIQPEVREGGGQRGNGAQNREKHIVFEEHREVGKVSN